MSYREQPKSVEKLRERIVALVKRSAEKFEEMKGIQARIDQLASQLAKANEGERPESPKQQPDGEHKEPG